MKDVPFVGYIQAGPAVEAYSGEAGEITWVPAEDVEGLRNARTLRVRGDSMQDVGVYDGDLILVDDCPEPRNGQIVIAFLIDEEAVTLKCWQWKDGGRRVHLMPANSDYQKLPRKEYEKFVRDKPADWVRCHGVLVKVVRTIEP